jgi:hypothetical protein
MKDRITECVKLGAKALLFALKLYFVVYCLGGILLQAMLHDMGIIIAGVLFMMLEIAFPEWVFNPRK